MFIRVIHLPFEVADAVEHDGDVSNERHDCKEDEKGVGGAPCGEVHRFAPFL